MLPAAHVFPGNCYTSLLLALLCGLILCMLLFRLEQLLELFLSVAPTSLLLYPINSRIFSLPEPQSPSLPLARPTCSASVPLPYTEVQKVQWLTGVCTGLTPFVSLLLRTAVLCSLLSAVWKTIVSYMLFSSLVV